MGVADNMRTAYQDSYTTIIMGDSLDVLRAMEPESVQCVVTSPPYWGLRDYGADGQIGLEPTPEEYCANMAGSPQRWHTLDEPWG